MRAFVYYIGDDRYLVFARNRQQARDSMAELVDEEDLAYRTEVREYDPSKKGEFVI